jgi:uncharacterized iron-regulated protein
VGLALRFVLCLLLAATAAGGCARTAHRPAAADARLGAAGPRDADALKPGDMLVSNGRTVTPIDLNEFAFLSSLSNGADYVLVGEGHTVACDHTAQTRIIAALAGAGRQPVVGLEMVSEDAQDVLDSFNSGAIPLEKLPEALDWAHTWRFDFSLYAPIFKLSRAPEMPPLYALNVPSRVVRTVSRDGVDAVDEADRRYLPERILPPPRAQEEALEEEFRRHQAMGAENATSRPRASIERFFLVQSLWDTKMAERAVLLHKRFASPVVVLAGAGHVEYGWGIAARIKTLDPGAKVVSVLPWRGGPMPDPDQANAFFYCPQTHASRLGFTLEWVDAATETPGNGDKEGAGGRAMVLDVAEDSPAAAAGVQPGDAIVAANGAPLDGLWSLHEAAMKAKGAGKPLGLTVLRDGRALELAVELE